MAVVAYLAATGKPDLDVDLLFPFSPDRSRNPPVILYTTRDVSDADWDHARCRVFVHNWSLYSARNPGVRIELVGFKGLIGRPQPGWSVVARDWEGKPSLMVRPWERHQGEQVQWDGGADYMIHGKWSRQLPDLNFRTVELDPNTKPWECALRVTVVADGVRPKTSTKQVVPFDYDEWQKYG